VNRTDKRKSARKAETQNHGSKAATITAMIARSPKTSYHDQQYFWLQKCAKDLDAHIKEFSYGIQKSVHTI
jgi:hypothetical protein